MDISKMIKHAALHKDMSMKDLADELGRKPSSLNRSLDGNTVKFRDVLEICDALGAEFDYAITFKDGMKIRAVDPEKPNSRPPPPTRHLHKNV